MVERQGKTTILCTSVPTKHKLWDSPYSITKTYLFKYIENFTTKN